jgi:hypothetical protein
MDCYNFSSTFLLGRSSVGVANTSMDRTNRNLMQDAKNIEHILFTEMANPISLAKPLLNVRM